ncbi:MAG: polyprenyl synthetase family protein [Desulfobulbaceae bacterium]|nr:MAG: polyprenyl synthetase family protein [Desulfobulbaceae bacterium]
MDIKEYLADRQTKVEQALESLLPPDSGPLTNHIEAMRYSLLAGGKRIRPILCLAAAEALSTSAEPLLPLACALECIHTYSLIHDDLPAMDDDDLRRGVPTSHKKFGEAAAILAGDGLLSLAFELLTSPLPDNPIRAEDRLRIVHNIAVAVGPRGMVGGQALDIEAEGPNRPTAKPLKLEELHRIHCYKTGALITAAVQTGAIAGGADQRQYAALSVYGQQIGLAFQIVDDLLDVTADSATLGRATGSDAARGKATYPALLGLEKTRSKATEAGVAAISALEIFDHHANPLRELARYIVSRKR